MIGVNENNKFSDFILHKKIAKKLNTKTYNNFNNLLVYGINGVGKKYIVYTLIRKLFNVDKLDLKDYSIDLKINNANVTVNYVKSKFHYEINLYEYGHYDKNIIVEFLKDMVSTKNVYNNSYKIVLLHRFDKISESAQLTLRRIIELYADNCRFIIISNNLSKINYALLSRFELIRVPFPNNDELIEYCLKNNTFNYKNDIIQKICNTTYNKHNLCIINYNLLHNLNDFKKIDINIKIDEILKSPPSVFMDNLRKYIYRLHLLNCKYDEIIKGYLIHIFNTCKYKNNLKEVISKAAECEYKCRISKVHFFSLEYFFVYLKSLSI